MKLHANKVWIGGLGCLLALASGVAFGQTQAERLRHCRICSGSGPTQRATRTLKRSSCPTRNAQKFPAHWWTSISAPVPPEAATEAAPGAGS